MTPYSVLIDQQNAIGWDHFLCGKLSKEWDILQYHYARRYSLVKLSEGWVLKLIRLMVTLCYTPWDKRNTCSHGHDSSSSRMQLQHDQAHRAICCLYLLQDKVLAWDQHLFWNTADEHLTQSTIQLCSWIQHNKKLILHTSCAHRHGSTQAQHTPYPAVSSSAKFKSVLNLGMSGVL
jgi:hypothetical protein